MCAMTKSAECVFFFFFNDTATTEIYTLSLHDALPICQEVSASVCLTRRISGDYRQGVMDRTVGSDHDCEDRKSTRLNSSHMSESRMPSSA